MPFFRKRTIWWPTWLGFASIFAVVGAVTAVWWFEGEKFLSLTERQPADVLVVEGWISTPEINAAAVEFKEENTKTDYEATITYFMVDGGRKVTVGPTKMTDLSIFLEVPA